MSLEKELIADKIFTHIMSHRKMFFRVRQVAPKIGVTRAQGGQGVIVLEKKGLVEKYSRMQPGGIVWKNLAL